MKLSPRMREVLRFMVRGWELGEPLSVGTSSPWIQRGGCGRGGPSRRIHSFTLDALRSRGLIEVKRESYPARTWKLTAAGRKAAKEL